MGWNVDDLSRLVLLFGPAFSLCLLGLFLALRSGGVRLSTPEGLRQLAVNASWVALRLCLWLVAILAVLDWVGARVLLRNW